MSRVIATAKMRITIETSFTRGSRLCSRPLRWAMLSFTRHSSKNVKMLEIAFWTKPFFLQTLTVQQAQGAGFDLLHPLRYHRISFRSTLNTLLKWAGCDRGPDHQMLLRL